MLRQWVNREIEWYITRNFRKLKKASAASEI